MSAFAQGHSDKSGHQDRARIMRLAVSATCFCGIVDASGAASDRAVEEVIVTAQKRQERLQDVPISISVLGGDILDKSTAQGMTEVLTSVPGVSISLAPIGGGTQVAVRGVTAGAPLFAGASPIGYYLDTVPFGFVKTAIAPDASAYDLERVEALRGPQGTLYGASAMNGVVRILTKDAGLNEFEFKARTSGSTTDKGGENYRGDMALNVPLVEGKLAMRAVAGYQDSSGWIDKQNQQDANDSQITNLRLKINAQPTDSLSIGAFAWVSRSDYGAPSISADGLRAVSVIDEPTSTDYDTFGLKIDYDFSSFSFTSATSYIDFQNLDVYDGVNIGLAAGTNIRTRLNAKTLAQEINLVSTHGGAWRWAVGAIYRDGEDRSWQRLSSSPGPLGLINSSESFAMFGSLTRLFLGGRLELTAGLRYFEDSVDAEETDDSSGRAPLGTYYSSKFHANSPRVVLTWHSTEHSTLYASYSEGFRSGVPQNSGIFRATTLRAAEPDNLESYEIGTKGDWLKGRMTYDVAVYYINWQNVQQQVSLFLVPPGSYFLGVVNGVSANGPGVDFGLTSHLTDRLTFGVNFSWNDLNQDQAVITRTAAVPQGIQFFAKGDRLNLSPEYTAGASLGYDFPLGAGGYEMQLSASANYTSSQNQRALVGATVTNASGDSMTVGRASVAIESPNRWTATLFADNINNEQGAPTRGASLTNRNQDTRIRPRTIGAQFEYRFE